MDNKEKVIRGLQCLARTKEPTSNPCADCGYIDCPNFAICVVDVAIDALELLKEPSAKDTNVPSKQKYGHWVFDPDGIDWNIPAWKCSECHCKNDNIPPNLEKTNPLRWSGSKYCPNCGAKMDGGAKKNG